MVFIGFTSHNSPYKPKNVKISGGPFFRNDFRSEKKIRKGFRKETFFSQ